MMCCVSSNVSEKLARRVAARWATATLAVGLWHCGGRTGLDVDSIQAMAGSAATGANSAMSGNPAAGLDSAGGRSATGGAFAAAGNGGSGCTSSLEVIEKSTGLCVARTATIVGPDQFSNYQIDVTEVTQGQYDDWLATKPALPVTSDVNCGYVTGYGEQGTGDVYKGADADHHPVVYVDWCDANRYCTAVNKRLCGAVGGGSNTFDSYADATRSQWYRACSSGGAYEYPYGNAYQSGTCNSYDYWNGSTLQTVAVGSLPNCVTTATGYAGVCDLSGNVWEWEDSCTGSGVYANCRVRGGSFYSSGSVYLACDFDNYNYRISVGSNFGFRCCSP